MVQKSEPKRRGRPRAYDAERALKEARAAFWEGGYAATSLDDLSAATAMNRPSLYAAFGDKRALYLKALDSYRAESRAAVRETLAAKRPLIETLRAFYAKALSIYVASENAARGCFLIGPALADAVNDPEVRALLADSIGELDAAFETCFRRAKQEGELPEAADPTALAKIASATLHTLAIRARAGMPRPELDATAEAAVALICGRG